MKYTLITPTGDRPEAFALCERYMARQTMPHAQWIVLDDGEVETRCTLGQQYVRCPQYRGRASLVNKLMHCFSHNMITGHAVAFIEDDDWYHPTYLETMARALHDVQLVGEGRAMYYNVYYRWWYVHDNMRHASLCQTVIKRAAFPALIRLLADKCPYLDVRLWKSVPSRCVYPPMPDHRLLIGIKSMPGRPGYGIGHDDNRDAVRDPDLRVLKQMIGKEDAAIYEQYAKK